MVLFCSLRVTLCCAKRTISFPHRKDINTEADHVFQLISRVLKLAGFLGACNAQRCIPRGIQRCARVGNPLYSPRRPRGAPAGGNGKINQAVNRSDTVFYRVRTIRPSIDPTPCFIGPDPQVRHNGVNLTECWEVSVPARS